MIDPAAEAFSRAGILRVGVLCTFERLSGQAPRAVTFSATVAATVSGAAPDSEDPRRQGYGSANAGGLTENQRRVIVMASDLLEQRFPLPLRKGDRILAGDPTGTGQQTTLTIDSADPFRRALAGAIEIMASGV